MMGAALNEQPRQSGGEWIESPDSWRRLKLLATSRIGQATIAVGLLGPALGWLTEHVSTKDLFSALLVYFGFVLILVGSTLFSWLCPWEVKTYETPGMYASAEISQVLPRHEMVRRYEDLANSQSSARHCIAVFMAAGLILISVPSAIRAANVLYNITTERQQKEGFSMNDHRGQISKGQNANTGLVLSGRKVKVETDSDTHEGELVEENFHGDIVIENDDGSYTVIPKHRIKHYKTVP